MKLYFLNVNEKANTAELKAKGIEGVYICASKGRQKNPLFDANYEALKDSGFKIGFYHSFEAPTLKKHWTLESCKEGRAFGAVIRGLSYGLDLCVDFAPGFFDSEEDYRPTVFYNAINGFTQKLDLYLDKPINESKRFVIRASEKQMEAIEQRKANCKYQLMIK